jgi:hypothetical protein
MIAKSQEPPGAGGSCTTMTDDAGSTETVCVEEFSIVPTQHSRLKVVLVDALSDIFSWSPSLAALLGRVIRLSWRGFKGA